MRAVRQPAHRATVIMVAHNAVKITRAPMASVITSLSRCVQRFQGACNIGEHHGRAVGFSTVRARMIRGFFPSAA